MSKIETVSVELSPELIETIREAVTRGDYESSDDVVQEALRDWLERRELRAAAIEKLGAAWDEGVASGIAPRRRSAEEIVADGRRALAARKSA
ncbi:hypothetical protein [Phenylobacterium sp.]|uniref:ribbon-helix-helix domain-containing protein n=1 Tax=Phenylobacterium sp. TaxID=1871053 RepID=UPI00271BBD30|nr:hypothetical protein [Phenylobacterium sp.]MDO8378344.1 hypothetical protein [Phenylobacterium sp.]